MLQMLFKQKQNTASKPSVDLSIDEKKFYLYLYNHMPVDYTLAFHSDIINLNSLIMKNKENFSKNCLFLEQFNNQHVDFIVLDKKLEPTCVVIFDHPKGEKTQSELYKTLIDLNIPVFTYSKQDKYNFEDLLFFLKKH